MSGEGRRGVLFVCLGNICRSPLALVVFSDMVQRQGREQDIDIDSCGTGAWHVGHGADPRTIAIAARHGLKMIHTARQLDPLTDFGRFELIVAMDRNNRDTLLGEGAPAARVRLMRSFDPAMSGLPEADLDVPDPYYGAGDGFETVYRMLVAASEGLLTEFNKDSRA
jgi:protein-tyrosine phosphatase